MAIPVVIPINYIEVVELNDERIARIIGTQLSVGEIAHMFLYGDSSVEWLVENFESLTEAKIYAALSYYYDHQSEIDTWLKEARRHAEENADTTLDVLISQARARLK